MKKLIMLTLALGMILSSFVFTVSGEGESVTVYVTIANGNLALVKQQVAVNDVDGDGKITINDSLVAAHREYYPGIGDGYAYEITAYGISMTMLWGVENGGSYGYYVNDSMALSLADELHEGDYVYAFAYTDTVNFSDTYSYFDISSVSAAVKEEFTLTLYSLGLDENWQPVVAPVEAATIVVDGNITQFKTDSQGRVTLSLDTEGEYVISAVSESINLLPPVCLVKVEKETPVTSDRNMNVVYISLAAVAIVIIAAALNRKVGYEK